MTNSQKAREHGAQFTINAATEDFSGEGVRIHTRQRRHRLYRCRMREKFPLIMLQATGNAGRVITMGFSTAPTEVNQFLITSKELDVRGFPPPE